MSEKEKQEITSSVPKTVENAKTQEEIYAEKLLNDGFIELHGPLYPSENNLFYDGLNQKNLVECFRTFTNADRSLVYSIVTFGKKMCGHKGILHGGSSASTLDQFFGLMNSIADIRGFTGQLNCSYRKIILCPSTVLIRGTFDRVERRKHYFKAVIYDEVNDPCVEAECLFIQSDIEMILGKAVSKLEHSHESKN